MAKIKVEHMVISPSDGYMYIIDTHGNIWKWLPPNGTWQSAGELPEDPESHNPSRISA